MKEDAQALVGKVLSRNPNQSFGLLMHALILWDCGDQERAREQLARAQAVIDEMESPNEFLVQLRQEVEGRISNSAEETPTETSDRELQEKSKGEKSG
jgi:hypothetical protein